MSTLDEGLMATLTQEERDAMKEDDATNESVDAIDQPDDEAKSEEVARNESAKDASDASSVDTKSDHASYTEQSTQETRRLKLQRLTQMRRSHALNPYRAMTQSFPKTLMLRSNRYRTKRQNSSASSKQVSLSLMTLMWQGPLFKVSASG
jgi:hypothetical protein